MRLAAGGAFLAEETLSYDGHGRVAASSMVSIADVALDLAQGYTYDAAGRLVSWTVEPNETTPEDLGISAQSLTTGTTAYAYDAAGNLIEADGPSGATTFTSDADDRLTSATTGGVTTTYTSDVFGRRTSESGAEGDLTYAWNSLGQLTSVGSEDTTSTYLYGPTGMREQVRVETAQGATTTQSAWMGSRLASELDSDGTRYRYLYGPDGLPLELVVTTGSTSVSYAYQCDHAGSVVALTGASGAVVATYAYDPYGRVTAVGGSDLALARRNPLRYRGYYYDTETGHYYLPARYYDPEVARFLSADPASPTAGDPLSLNRYAYCVGDPVNASDPSGATIDIDGDGKLDYEDVHYQNEQAQSQAAARTAAKRAVSFAAAAASTVYHVLFWTSCKYSELMTGAMWSQLGAFPTGGPPKVSWYAHSVASAKRVLSALSPVMLGSQRGGAWYALTSPSKTEIALDAVSATLDFISVAFIAGGVVSSATVAGAPAGVPCLAAGMTLKVASWGVQGLSAYLAYQEVCSGGTATAADIGLDVLGLASGGAMAKLAVDFATYDY